MLGCTCMPSIARCAGELTLATGIVAPLEPQPVGAGAAVVVVAAVVVAAAAMTTAVGTEVELALPSLFEAVTRTRNVFAASGPTSW